MCESFVGNYRVNYDSGLHSRSGLGGRQVPLLLFNSAVYLEPVRESYRTDKSIEWVRVHRLADYVYFNHSIHINKGVGCSSCHGQVNQMPLMFQASPLLMAWCVDCHRNPEAV